MSETEPSVESWEGFITNFLKAENIEGQEGIFDCFDMKMVTYPNSKDPILSLGLKREGEKFVFDLNVTNMAFLKKNGIKAPKDIIDKRITVGKIKVMNPQTKQEVDGLRITKVEKIVKEEKVE